MTKTETEKQPKQSEILLDLISPENGFDFFQDEHETAFCRYPTREGIYENRRICERKFKSYLSRLYRQHTGKSIGEPALKEALIELEGRALHEKSSRKERVYIRCAEKDGKIYLDLCNPDWQAVEISPAGWRILNSDAVPVRFERPGHAAPFPDPNVVSIGDINKLWEIINIPRRDRLLVVAYILESFHCGTAFPVLLLVGLQGSGKSVTQSGIRSLIDPSASNLRIAPKKQDDIVVEAASNWMVSYNNVSALSDEMHDDFCCISTGSGFSTRRFYTNMEQVIVNVARPVAMNGIYNFIRRPDLLDRSIIIELPSIDNKQRKTDSELQSMLNEFLPIIFRGLLDLMAKTLKILPSVRIADMTRLADFALLGTAMERAMGEAEGAFMKEYRRNRSDAKEGSLESSPVIVALLDYVDRNKDGFRGTPTELLAELTTLKNPSPHLNWPKTGQKMGAELRRYDAVLRQNGVIIVHEKNESGKKNKRGNVIRISKDDTPPSDSEKKSTKSIPPSGCEEEPTVNAVCNGASEVDFPADITADISGRSSHTTKDVHSETDCPTGFSGDDRMEVHTGVHTDIHSPLSPSKLHKDWAQEESSDPDNLNNGHSGLQNPACTVAEDDGDSALLI